MVLLFAFLGRGIGEKSAENYCHHAPGQLEHYVLNRPQNILCDML